MRLPPPAPPPAPPPPPAPAAPAPALFGPPPPPPAPAVAVDPDQRLRGPTIVVDLGAAGDEARTVKAVAASPQSGASSGAPSLTAAVAPAGGTAGALAEALGQRVGGAASVEAGETEFASRISEERPARATATPMSRLDAVIPQGAIIPAVLETAINSDLPGYARAIVSRDVRSFDGRVVLIPRGSRVIGQYKSALSLGASRAFVIWSRIIRPDGVSIQIGSPGGDALGRGGLDGKVERHFFGRFGGSILLSILNGGIAALTGNPGTQITIGSPGAAIGAAGQAVQGDSIPPTVKVPQGSAVRIFVARDLDFAGVGAVR